MKTPFLHRVYGILAVSYVSMALAPPFSFIEDVGTAAMIGLLAGAVVMNLMAAFYVFVRPTLLDMREVITLARGEYVDYAFVGLVLIMTGYNKMGVMWCLTCLLRAAIIIMACNDRARRS